ncbi:hypothetical protein ACOMHN_003968 [Nucella lapillus]
MVKSYRLHNQDQCQRLCWYWKTCGRYSFYHKNDTSGDNCVLHGRKQTAGNLVDGWTEEEASSRGMSPDKGCISRPCRQREMCIPVHTNTQFLCVPMQPDTWLYQSCSGTCRSPPSAGPMGCFHGQCLCAPGYFYSQSERTCLAYVSWLGQSCSGTCRSPPSAGPTDCFHGQCLCAAGYFYSQSKRTCSPSEISEKKMLEPDRLLTGSLDNPNQCQTLCWYWNDCGRYSFYHKNDNRGDNCVLHGRKQTAGNLVDGWTEEEASSRGMACGRYSFYHKNDTSGDNCVLHGRQQTAGNLVDGWTEDEAAPHDVPCTAGCRFQPSAGPMECINNQCLCASSHFYSKSEKTCLAREFIHKGYSTLPASS